MSKDSSREVMTEVLARKGPEVAAPKFKWRKVSAVQDFPPGCGRATASDFELSRQIAVDQSNQGSGDYEYLVLYVIKCVLLSYL
ncbi:hypothetical protein J1N35_044439 [Gossypium stocksii]|uniref:Uncharacterized protein n=1 Tax=Gossypium stocksii TaxID=47602 RepID=A0A9D3U9D7_9ROSI|nr:hypothetical protein J1N35_044439 [Gossypium stocksii]